jgi:hypothetical protein
MLETIKAYSIEIGVAIKTNPHSGGATGDFNTVHVG